MIFFLPVNLAFFHGEIKLVWRILESFFTSSSNPVALSVVDPGVS